jgi:hypothetical protein
MKFLILLFYYERPEMLNSAIQSVLQQDYHEWEVFLIDDGVKFKARDHVDLRCFSENKLTLVEIGDNEQVKLKRQERQSSFGGSIFGAFANTAMSTTDATHAIMLCDDDELKPDYLSKLRDWYSCNDSNYSYCHLEFKDPNNGSSVENDYTRYLNSKSHPINPVNEVDSSQVSWSVEAWRNSGIHFPYPQTSHLDRSIFQQMYSSWGDCRFNGITGQIKGIHKEQLIHR